MRQFLHCVPGNLQKMQWTICWKKHPDIQKRHSGHKQEIKNKTGGLGHHYGGNGCGYANVSFQVIDQVDLGDDHELAECETYWQHQLRWYVENGGNAHCYRKEITRSTNC